MRYVIDVLRLDRFRGIYSGCTGDVKISFGLDVTKQFSCQRNPSGADGVRSMIDIASSPNGKATPTFQTKDFE